MKSDTALSDSIRKRNEGCRNQVRIKVQKESRDGNAKKFYKKYNLFHRRALQLFRISSEGKCRWAETIHTASAANPGVK